jgi:hypothetical protein
MEILTTVWTDGMGTYQGRCVHCEWRGRWTKSQDGAATEASEHGGWHAAIGHAACEAETHCGPGFARRIRERALREIEGRGVPPTVQEWVGVLHEIACDELAPMEQRIRALAQMDRATGESDPLTPEAVALYVREVGPVPVGTA